MSKEMLANGKAEVRFDDRGEFDELCIKSASVHLEMMDDTTLWIGFDIPGEEYPVHVWVSARGKLRIKAMDA